MCVIKGGINAGITDRLWKTSHSNYGKAVSQNKSSPEDAEKRAPGENDEDIRYHTFPIVSKIADKDSYYNIKATMLAGTWYLKPEEVLLKDKEAVVWTLRNISPSGTS